MRPKLAATAVATAVAAGILGLSAGTASAGEAPDGYVLHTTFYAINDCDGTGHQGMREGKWVDYRCVGRDSVRLWVLPTKPVEYSGGAKQCTDGGGTVMKVDEHNYACRGGKYDDTGWQV
ncbi:hypothetical protein ACFV0Y_07440 [Streptomyces sp. NPDC059569]|uniref:hypothetical protein n=1 Tax=Streptomyces sp. NPDC059569 TaxID=3346869 RepID=UPI0036C79300